MALSVFLIKPTKHRSLPNFKIVDGILTFPAKISKVNGLVWYNIYYMIVLMRGQFISEWGNTTKYHRLLANTQGFVSNYSFTITKWKELYREHLVSWYDVRFTEFYFRSSCCSITPLLSLQSWRQSELSSAESLRSLQKSFVCTTTMSTLHSFLVHRHCVKLLNKIIEHVRC